MTREPVTEDEAAALMDSMPFARMVGVQAISAGPDEVRGRLDWRPDNCTTGGVMHGGALMTLADSLGAICAVLNLPQGAWTGTIESKTNFFRAVRGDYAEGVSHPLHVGRTTIVVQTDIFDAENRLVAQVTQTQAVLYASV